MELVTLRPYFYNESAKFHESVSRERKKNMKNTKRKGLLAVLLTLAMMLILAVPAFAASGSSLYAGGKGTKASPYHIQTAKQLQNMNKNLGSWFVLDNDIDLSGVNWTPVGYYGIDLEDFENPPTEKLFHGNFNGNGYTISNLSLKTANILGAGLFGSVGDSGKVHDVKLKNFNVQGIFLVGGLSGYACGNAVFENITMTGKNNMSGLQLVGGIVGGSTNKTFKNIAAKANIKITMPYMGAEGGIIVGGAEDGNFMNCKVTGGTIKANGTACYGLGGISGSTIGSEKVTNCTVKNLIITAGKDASMVGGLAGYTGENPEEGPATVISGCKVSDTTIKVGDGSERIGMLVGSGYYTKLKKSDFPKPCNFIVKNCTVSGTIEGGIMVGAITGYAQKADSITNVTCNVTAYGKTAPKVGGTPSTNAISTLK